MCDFQRESKIEARFDVHRVNAARLYDVERETRFRKLLTFGEEMDEVGRAFHLPTGGFSF